MDFGAIGFFVGALPGGVLIYRAGLPMRKLHKQVEQIALAERKAFSVHFDLGQKSNFIFQPERLLDEGDSAELRAAKLRFLAGRDKFIRSQMIGGATLFVGAAVGAIAGTVLGA